jgi:hypothetical protein
VGNVDLGGTTGQQVVIKKMIVGDGVDGDPSISFVNTQAISHPIINRSTGPAAGTLQLFAFNTAATIPGTELPMLQIIPQDDTLGSQPNCNFQCPVNATSGSLSVSQPLPVAPAVAATQYRRSVPSTTGAGLYANCPTEYVYVDPTVNARTDQMVSVYAPAHQCLWNICNLFAGSLSISNTMNHVRFRRARGLLVM